MAKLTEEQKKQIVLFDATGEFTKKELAEKFGVSQATIYNICDVEQEPKQDTMPYIEPIRDFLNRCGRERLATIKQYMKECLEADIDIPMEIIEEYKDRVKVSK